MKKTIISTPVIIGALIGASILTYSIISYITKINAKAVISEDYSTITYNGKVYKSYIMENAGEFPEFNEDSINATVNERSFLWDGFLMDYIFISENEIYIYLITDYDFAESKFYNLKE